MPYVDLNTIHNPATGTVAPATWGDQVRDNDEFLIDPPACSVFNSTTQSLTTGVATIMNADSENFDNNGMHSTVTNNSRITINTAGRYLLSVRPNYAANSTGAREVRIHQNGALLVTPHTGGAAPSGNTRFSVALTVVAALNDYFEVAMLQNSGGNLTCSLDEFAAIYLTR